MSNPLYRCPQCGSTEFVIEIPTTYHLDGETGEIRLVDPDVGCMDDVSTGEPLIHCECRGDKPDGEACEHSGTLEAFDPGAWEIVCEQHSPRFGWRRGPLKDGKGKVRRFGSRDAAQYEAARLNVLAVENERLTGARAAYQAVPA